MRYLFFALLLSTCSGGTPAYAKVLPEVWDGKCTPIHMSPYYHQNPEDVKTQTGHIPPELQDNDSDILACLPPLGEH